jgi:hypothetical protein
MLPVRETHSPTKHPVLYYRDPLECIQELMSRPELADCLDLVPCKIYSAADRSERIYTEWLSGNMAWSLYVGVFILLTHSNY